MTAGSTRLRVISVGGRAADAARIAASKRSAQTLHVPVVDDCLAVLEDLTSDPVLLVVDLDEVTARQLLDVVGQATIVEDRPIGFLYGRGEQQLVESARRFRSVPHQSPSDGVQRLFSMIGEEVHLAAALLDNPKSAGAQPQGIAQALTDDVELTILVGHSSGIDMSVGGTLLCRRPAVGLDPAGTARAYPCFSGSPCARQMYGVTRNEALLSMDHVGARRAIWLSCYGIIVTPGIFDPRLMIGDSLLHNRAEAVITTLRATLIDSVDAMTLYWLVRRGLPFGAIANQANLLRQRRGLPADFLCFGDPESRLPANLEVIDAMEDGDGFVATLPPHRANAHDVALRLPRAFATARHAIRSSTDSANLALVASDVVFATNVLPQRGQLRFKVETLDAFRALERDFGAMIRSARFLEHFLANVAKRLDPASPVVAAAQDRLAEFMNFLHTASFSVPSAGASVSAATYRAVELELELHLSQLSAQFAIIYLELGQRFSGFSPSIMWQSAYRSSGFSDRQLACCACGGAVDVVAWRLRGELDRRETGYCHTCGPVLDGPSVDAIRVDMEQDVVRGRTYEVVVWVDCALVATTSACATAMLPPFVPTGREPLHDVAAVSLDPGQAMAIPLRFEVPADWPTGIHFLCVMSMVGGATSFARFPVMVLPA